MSDSQTVAAEKPPETASGNQVDKSENRVRQMFAEIAPKYDLMNHLLSMNVDRWWRRRTVARLAPQPDWRVLDVCTGTGDLAIALLKRMLQGKKDQEALAVRSGIWSSTEAEQADLSGCRVVASDFCRPMLEIGEKKAQKFGANQLQFVEADSMQLPFPSNSFDLVTVAFGLRNVSDTLAGLQEMVRVCRAGGQVGVLEFTMPRLWPLSSLYRFYFLKVLPRVGQCFAKNRSDAYSYLPESVGQFPQYEELVAMMQQAGLRDTKFFPMTMGLATLYVGVKA